VAGVVQEEGEGRVMVCFPAQTAGNPQGSFRRKSRCTILWLETHRLKHSKTAESSSSWEIAET
jgi:hypothetical protein